MKNDIITNEEGATIVEFSVGLVFSILMFCIFLSFFMVIYSHERMMVANFKGARDFSIHGESKSMNTISEIDPQVSVLLSQDNQLGSLSLDKDVSTIIDLNNLPYFGKGEFTINNYSKVFIEPDLEELGGDN